MMVDYIVEVPAQDTYAHILKHPKWINLKVGKQWGNSMMQQHNVTFTYNFFLLTSLWEQIEIKIQTLVTMNNEAYLSNIISIFSCRDTKIIHIICASSWLAILYSMIWKIPCNKIFHLSILNVTYKTIVTNCVLQ